MGQKKGQTGNPNGRPKGAKNKISSDIKDKLTLFLEDNFDKFETSFKMMPPGERKARLYLEAGKLIIPRPKDPEEEAETNRRHDELLSRLFPQKE